MKSKKIIEQIALMKEGREVYLAVYHACAVAKTATRALKIMQELKDPKHVQQRAHIAALYAKGLDAPDLYSDTFEIGNNFVIYYYCDGTKEVVKL
jgi:hypothetical protein